MMNKHLVWLVIMLCAGCNGIDARDTSAFVLRTNVENLGGAFDQILFQLAYSLQASEVLDADYPQVGLIVIQPDPTEPGVDRLSCIPGDLKAETANACLLLNTSGDFIRIQTITWESAAFYMYRFYAAPTSLFSKINPARDFIAVDVFTLEEPDLWAGVDNAIHEAAEEIKARPYRH